MTIVVWHFSYPDATSQDIENSDNVCIICRENMVGNGSCKKLPCNHIFHVTCLRSWFQRQQTCPTCRMDVLRVGGPANANNNGNDAANANNNNNNANGQLPQMPPFLAGGPMMFQQFQQLFQRPNNNNQNANAAAAPAGPANQRVPPTGAGAAPTNLPPPPPIVIPPAMLPFLQTPPFPLPQLPIEALLQGLTDQELRKLEGSERQNIEARIKCLTDVKTLINAATFRLQQYNNILLDTQKSVSVSTQTDPPSQSQWEPTPSTSGASRSTSSPKVDPPVAGPSSSSVMTGNSGDDTNDEQEMIRKRRLERFSQAADPPSGTTPDNSAQK